MLIVQPSCLSVSLLPTPGPVYPMYGQTKPTMAHFGQTVAGHGLSNNPFMVSMQLSHYMFPRRTTLSSVWGWEGSMVGGTKPLTGMLVTG